MIWSYVLSDFVKSTVFLPFEARKQRIQLAHSSLDIIFPNVFKYMLRAYPALLIRDTIFRVITFSSFLNSLNVEHKPRLKYNLEEIRDYIKIKEKQGEKYNVSYFMDYSKFNITSPFSHIMLNLLLCTVVATVITHPLDVIITKMLTQTRLKYKGIIQSFRLISKEENYKKLFFSGLSVRFSFNMLSAMSVLVFYESMVNYFNKYFED
jgi:hypothetical protein